MTFLTIFLVVIHLGVLAAVVAMFRSGVVTLTPAGTLSTASDAKQSETLLGEINDALSGHADSLGDVDRSGDRGDAEQMEQCVAELRRTNRAAGNSIDEKNKQLANVLSKYGSLYGSECKRIDCYTQHVYELDNLLAEFERDAEESNRLLLRFVRDMVQENRQLQVKVSDCQEQVTDLISRSVKSEKDARTDSLTQLPNRRAWDEKLAELQNEESFAIGLIDVDNFKGINDVDGHAAGDAMLTLIGTILRSADGVSAYRIGGDEFAVILPSGDEEASADAIRRRIASSVLHFGDKKLSSFVSIGIARRVAGQSMHALLCCADDALYEAKAAEGNQVRLNPTGLRIVASSG